MRLTTPVTRRTSSAASSAAVSSATTTSPHASVRRMAGVSGGTRISRTQCISRSHPVASTPLLHGLAYRCSVAHTLQHRAWMLVTLDPRDERPLYLQIVEQVRRAL